METAAKRIVWGKMLNAGQTCIAPDYVLCSTEVQDQFVNAAKKVMHDFYQSDAFKSDSFARIINCKNFDRLIKLLDDTSGNIVIGGQRERDSCYIAPTVVTNVTASDSLMSEEIFGPILPIVTVDSAEEAIELINRGEKPLTLYLFSNKKDVVNRFLEQTSSGSVCVNDCLMQAAGECTSLPSPAPKLIEPFPTVPTLPFGGVGNSGIGIPCNSVPCAHVE